MKVKDLKKLLENLPDDARIFASPTIAGLLNVTSNRHILAIIDVAKTGFDTKPHKVAKRIVKKEINQKVDPNFFKRAEG